MIPVFGNPNSWTCSLLPEGFLFVFIPVFGNPNASFNWNVPVGTYPITKCFVISLFLCSVTRTLGVCFIDMKPIP